MDKSIDKNGSFQSFWRSISTKKIDLDRDGISFYQNDQKPTSNDRDRSPKKFISRKTCQEQIDKKILSRIGCQENLAEKMGSSAMPPTPILEEQEQVVILHSEVVVINPCDGCPYWNSIDCTASFYEQVQHGCYANSEEIRYWLLRLDNLKYQPAGSDKDKAIIEINERLEELIE